MRPLVVAILLFFISLHTSLVGQNLPDLKKVESKVEKVAKDSAKAEMNKVLAKDFDKTEKLLKKLKKKLNFSANAKSKEQKRVDAIIKKYIEDANLLSGADVKKINDSLSKVEHLKIDSLGKLVFSLKKENEVLSHHLKLTKNDLENLSNIEPEVSEELAMDQLADMIIPLIKDKANEEEQKEEQFKKTQLIRALALHPDGVLDTVPLNDTLLKAFRLKLNKKEVFGFHPYWRNSDVYRNYDFTVLTSLVYYGYELDAYSGMLKDLHDWDKQAVSDFALEQGCKVYLGVYCQNESGIKALLSNHKVQESFFESIVIQLNAKKAAGINFIFGSPDGNYRLKFLKFIKQLNRRLKEANPSFSITLTLPVIDHTFFYDIAVLNEDVEFFIIDFSKKNERGPIVSISGNDFSLEAAIARYLRFNVAAEKFIACFPYHGVVWDSEDTKGFLHYMTYSEIIDHYAADFKVNYENENARIDVVFNKVDTLEQVWFDDAKTLGAKYQYVLANNLAGVAVWALGDDGFKTELWDCLRHNMITVDTVDVKEVKTASDVNPVPAPTLWDKIVKEVRLYVELFEHPCDFENQTEVIDGQLVTKRELLKADDYIAVAVLISFVLLVLVGIYSVYKNRELGDDWPYHKIFLVLLIILTVITVVLVLMFFFVDKDFGAFGAQGVAAGGDCEVRFGLLLKLVCIGFVIGGVATRFLVLPLLQSKEIP